jgi:hypothetical protein
MIHSSLFDAHNRRDAAPFRLSLGRPPDIPGEKAAVVRVQAIWLFVSLPLCR